MHETALNGSDLTNRVVKDRGECFPNQAAGKFQGNFRIFQGDWDHTLAEMSWHILIINNMMSHCITSHII